MKYALQIIVPCIVWFLVQTMGGKITIEPANVYLKGVNIALFLLAASVCFVGYVTFIQKEAKTSRKVCYTKAQWSCILGGCLSLSYAYTTWLWVGVIESGYNHPESIDILHSVNNIMLVVNLILNAELLNNTFFRKSFLPFGDPLPHKKKTLDTAMDMGFLSEDQKYLVLERQQKGDKEDDES